MIKSNRYFNNPAFAQAASNLSALFAPPSGADAAGWASAKAKKAEAARLAFLFDNPTDEHFDRRNIAVGNYAPTQSFYAQDQNNATNRYNIDTDASTSLANNAADNARALTERELIEAAAMDRLGITNATDRYDIDTDAATALATNAADNERALVTNRLDNQRQGLTQFYQPLNPGQVRPEVPDELAAIIGLPGAVPATQGLEKPVTQDELKAQIFADLPLEEQQAIVFGTTPVESVVTGEGPRIATRRDAIGQEPFINKGAEAKPTNATAVLADGTQVPARQGPDGSWLHAQTGEPLPADIQIMDLAKVTGSAEDVGLTTAVTSDVQKTILTIDNTLETAGTLRDLIAQNPSSQGTVGAIRRFSQNLFQTANELGQMGPGAKEITDAIRNGALDSGTANEFFDPTLPDIELLTNYLAWQYAKSMSGDRVSNEQLRQAREAIGGASILSNQADSLARLDRLMQQLESQKTRYSQFAPGIGSPERAPAAAPVAVGGSTRLRFDENGNPL